MTQSNVMTDSQKTIRITFPDGAEKEFSSGITGFEIAEGISKSLSKAVVMAEIDGEYRDLNRPITGDCKIRFIKRDEDEALPFIRHDAAHVMAEAVQQLFPGTQVTIGPVIENGFYYDFYRNQPFSSEDLEAIEKKMEDIIDRGAPFTREVWGRNEAIELFKGMNENFKVELIEDLPEDETITIYKQGDWLDLCRGPHMPTTKHVGKAFKLTNVAGAYWRGDSNRQMLTRIYGTAWRDKKELEHYLEMLEEAEKRDHRRLGREMDLFHLQEEAQGSVFWHPKGYKVWLELEKYIRRRLDNAGYGEVKTPQLIDNMLWERSGHWGKFRENMFVVPDEVPGTDEDDNILSGESRLMALKPMNCPAHVQIFKQGIKSYRDLPIRMSEFGCCHRNEAHGALHGLLRVRQMTQDDAHIFCTQEQIFDEIKGFLELFFEVYKDFGFENFKVLLATRPEKRGGDDSLWDLAEQKMAEVLQTLDIDFDYAEGEGAFYGPKYEFHLKDAIGRSWQVGTCQLDFVLPDRLEAQYVGEDGEKHNVVMIHRAVYGTLERFIGLLLESYGGKLPVWLAPVQCVVAPITDKAKDYAQDVLKKLKDQGLRCEIDTRNEKINYKIRDHSVRKVPYIYVVGEREAADNTVAVRELGGKDQKMMPLQEAIQTLVNKAKPPY